MEGKIPHLLERAKTSTAETRLELLMLLAIAGEYYRLRAINAYDSAEHSQCVSLRAKYIIDAAALESIIREKEDLCPLLKR